jgi:hypothetical protein
MFDLVPMALALVLLLSIDSNKVKSYKFSFRSRGDVRIKGNVGLTKAVSIDAYDGEDRDVFKTLRRRIELIQKYDPNFLLLLGSKGHKGVQEYATVDLKEAHLLNNCAFIKAVVSGPTHWMKSIEKPLVGPMSLDVTAPESSHSADTGSLGRAESHIFDRGVAPVRPKSTSSGPSPDNDTLLAAVTSLLELPTKENVPSYVRYQVAHALLTLKSQNLMPTALRNTGRVAFALERTYEWAFDELLRQVTAYGVGVKGKVEVHNLVYSLLTYWEIGNGAYLAPRTNIRFVQQALKAVFGCQERDGSWKRDEMAPATATSTAAIDTIDGHDATGKSTDTRDGSSRVFFVDVFGGLLSSIGSHNEDLLAPYASNIKRFVDNFF